MFLLSVLIRSYHFLNNISLGYHVDTKINKMIKIEYEIN